MNRDVAQNFAPKSAPMNWDRGKSRARGFQQCIGPASWQTFSPIKCFRRKYWRSLNGKVGIKQMSAPQYRHAHQKARAAALVLAYGQPCPLCNRTMEREERLHLDHVIPVIDGGAGGPTRIVHASCNIRRGNLLRGEWRAAWTAEMAARSQNW